MPGKNLILICDDDPVVHESLGLYLDSEGYDHISAYDGAQALEMAESHHPDLMILDLMMPKMTGTDVCRTVRQTRALPIIMLTAKSEEIDRILGLELGADDYIVKPFSPREVLARIRAVLRRYSEPQPDSDQIIRFPQLEVNLANYQVKALGQVIPFTPKEVEILHMLTSSAGQVFSREQMLETVWKYDYTGDARTVDVHIRRLREKIERNPAQPEFIFTKWGVGYYFTDKD